MIPYIDPARGDRVQTLLRGFRTTKCARRNFRCIGQDHAYVDVQRRYMIYHLLSPPFSSIPYSQSKYMFVDSLVNISLPVAPKHFL